MTTVLATPELKICIDQKVYTVPDIIRRVDRMKEEYARLEKDMKNLPADDIEGAAAIQRILNSKETAIKRFTDPLNAHFPHLATSSSR